MSNLDGKWTFADLNSSGWCHAHFNTKEEAVKEALKFESSFKNGELECIMVVGQLVDFCGSTNIENEEYVKR